MRDETEDNKPKPKDRLAQAHITAISLEVAIAAMEAHAAAAVADVAAQKDGAYDERNRLVAALAAVFPSALSRHPDDDRSWEDDWRWIVFIDLPTGQASWHLHDSHLSLFDHVQRAPRVWDGHTTPEKYERVARFCNADAKSHRESALAAVVEVVKERDEAREELGVVEANAQEIHQACRRAQARVAELEAEVERVRGLLQRGLDLNIVEANGGGVDEWENDVTAALAPQTPHAQIHPATTDLVHRFAAALREKLAAAEQKYGYSDNWRADDWLDECRAQLAAHVAKGDPRDVAAYCAFLWHHGASTAPQAPKEVPRG